MKKAQAEVVQEWRDKIATDNRWALRALLRVFSLQTQDEKSSGVTRHLNNVGFNGRDAEFATSLVVYWKRHQQFSPKQWAALRRLMPKYAGQLYRVTYEENPNVGEVKREPAHEDVGNREERRLVQMEAQFS